MPGWYQGLQSTDPKQPQQAVNVTATGTSLQESEKNPRLRNRMANSVERRLSLR